jgi:hypothetical protein
MKLFIVHSGTTDLVHYSTEKLFDYLSLLRPGQVINDAAAQTIASWWHNPDSRLTTVLSTMGQVDVRMDRETFATWDEYIGADPMDRGALDKLCEYIAAKIATAPSGTRPCACRDCFEIAIGIPGAMCGECDYAGCQYEDECSRDDAYGDSEDELCSDDSGDCTCLYCIPG